MRPADLLGLSFSALGRQKARAALTVLGVTVGTFALAVSLSVGRGVDRAIIELFRDTTALRTLSVNETYETVAEDVPESERQVEGAMSEAKRERLRRALVRHWGRRHVTRSRARLTPEAVAALGRIPHVERVAPLIQLSGWGSLAGEGEPMELQMVSVEPGEDYRSRVIAGRAFRPGDGRVAIVSELQLYRWGVTSDEQVRGVLGQEMRLEFVRSAGRPASLLRLLTLGEESFSTEEAGALQRALRRVAPLVRLAPIPRAEREAFAKLLARTPAGSEADPASAPRLGERFTVVGVVRDPDEGDEEPLGPLGNWASREAEVLIPTDAMAAFYLRAPRLAEEGFTQVRVTVDREDHVRAVAAEVEARGFQQYSLTQFIDTVRLNVLMVTLATAFIAVVALTVAAIGIANTMVMTVLERTHEIGVMKALGAREGQIRAIFLVEGLFIGLLGGVLGLLLAWGASYPGDAVARSIMESQTPRPIAGSLFVFPPWLTLGVPALAAVVATLAASYPARRAARVDPITSLRHD